MRVCHTNHMKPKRRNVAFCCNKRMNIIDNCHLFCVKVTECFISSFLKVIMACLIWLFVADFIHCKTILFPSRCPTTGAYTNRFCFISLETNERTMPNTNRVCYIPRIKKSIKNSLTSYSKTDTTIIK